MRAIRVIAVSVGAAAAAGAAMLAAFMTGEAWPHEAEATRRQPLGWSYDHACCNLMDCRAVADAAVAEGPDGYRIVATGEIVAHGDSRIRRSRDEFYHWCSVAGAPDSRTICLYVPDRGF